MAQENTEWTSGLGARLEVLPAETQWNHSWDSLAKYVAAFYPGPKNLPEGKIWRVLADKSSRQPSIDCVT